MHSSQLAGKKLHLANTVLMVRPIDFASNKETARDNIFMLQSEENKQYQTVQEKVHQRSEIQQKAIREYDRAVQVLRQNGINVISFDKHLHAHDFENVKLPDAVFANNWISTDERGNIVIYPMFRHSRNFEKIQFRFVLEELLRERFFVQNLHNFAYNQQCLEGTGAIVIDHRKARAYCQFSQRAQREIFEAWCTKFGFESIGFNTSSQINSAPYTHTNVMLSLGHSFAVVCADSILEKDRQRVITALLQDREVLFVTQEQTEKYFCANILQLQDLSERPLIVLSTRAAKGFTQQQLERLAHHGKLLFIDIPVIENVGGGSARSILAEIFLPKKNIVSGANETSKL